MRRTKENSGERDARNIAQVAELPINVYGKLGLRTSLDGIKHVRL